MTDNDPATDRERPGDLPAGDFAAWLTALQEAIRGEHDSDVPCGTCTACCTSSQFIHVGPDETDALTHIPRSLLFPAPGLPRGHMVLGYDERGHCPMLVDDTCTVYAHRPRTCRTYDCRIFPATGLAVDGGRIRIEAQARRWRFRHPTDADAARRDAVRVAAAYLEQHRDTLPTGSVPRNATQLAVLAIELHDLIGAADPANDTTGAAPNETAPNETAPNGTPPAGSAPTGDALHQAVVERLAARRSV